MKCFLKFVAMMIVFAGAIPPSAYSQTDVSRPERILLDSANRERAKRGLAPLKWSDALALAARQHATLLARQNTLSHQLPGEPPLQQRTARAGARFTMIAENVAEGPSAEGIHAQWMNSPHHRDNLLDPQLDSVGIAVSERNEMLFAVQDFSRAVSPLTQSEQEERVNALLRARGLRLSIDDVGEARKSCVLDNGYAGSHEPDFVIHYATPDLQSLPEMLEKRIGTGRYHAAVAGACSPNSKFGFSAYRVAVLLFKDE